MGWRRLLAKALGVRLGFRLERVVARVRTDEVLDGPQTEGGEELLLEDNVLVLHRDGSSTSYFHIVSSVRDPRYLDQWESHEYSTALRAGRVKVHAARVRSPSGVWAKARVNRIVGHMPDGKMGELVSILMPGLVPGCVVDLEMQFDWYDAGAYGPNVFGEIYLETSAPCRRRRYVVAVPRERELSVATYRWDGRAEVEQRGPYQVHRFEAEGCRGRFVDAMTPPARDEFPTVEISTLTGWASIAKAYTEQLRPVKGRLELPAALGADPPPDDPMERARWAYQFVSHQIRYGRHPDFMESLAARSPAETATELRGDCKDKVTLLSSLLREVGWKTSFVLVETLTATAREFLPAPRFDHTLLLIERDGVEVWLEPTPGVVDFGYVPGHLQGNAGLVLDDDEPTQRLLPSFPLESNQDTVDSEATLDPAGALAIRVHSVKTGDYASEAREFLRGLEPAQRLEATAMGIARRFPGARTERFEVGDLEGLDHPVEERIEVRIDRWAREAGDYRLLRLPWGYTADAGVVGHESRDRGLRLGNRRREDERIRVALPSGWRLVGGAATVETEVPEAGYHLTIAAADGHIVATRRFEVRERIVPEESYLAFKEFLEQVARDDRRDLVFVLAR